MDNLGLKIISPAGLINQSSNLLGWNFAIWEDKCSESISRDNAKQFDILLLHETWVLKEGDRV